MNNWLKSASELVVIRSSAQLLSKFTQLLDTELGCRGVYLLTPSADGRFVECGMSDSRQLNWSVSDFDNPFAHVIHSGKAMALQNSELLYWLSNDGFSDLIGCTDDSVKVVILPMLSKDGQLQAILVLKMDSYSNHDMDSDENFLDLLSVCANHLQLINEMEAKKRKSQLLSQSLIEVEQGKIKNHLLDGLANVLIGQSEVMKSLREQVAIAASSRLSVMIQGETGTGKELVSRAVHDLSSRSKASFVAINCAAIPEHLLESELFGYVKGAFSGADKSKKGLLADADGGTLFLDEIGDMPLALQAKLLRVLESHKYRPVGSEKELDSNFRLVIATHLNLKEQVLNNKFRKDLYYRLYQYPITLPRLKDRTSDIERLSAYFVEQYNAKHKCSVRGLHYKALDCLLDYDFPGNVRELKHLIEYGGAQTQDGEQIELAHIQMKLDNDIGSFAETEPKNRAVVELSGIRDLKVAVREYESNIIASRLREFDGDRGRTAESLGIPKRTLADKCLKLEISIND